MVKIRHIAFATEHPGKTAEFYKAAFGFRELSRFGLDPERPEEAKRPSGVTLTDGTLNVTILKFGIDQTGVGVDFRGFHHFGVVVDGDIDEWTKRLETLGAPNITGRNDIPPGAHFELKFRGPDGVVFDISDRSWPGSAPLDE